MDNSVGQTGQGVDYSDIRAISEKDLMRITIAMMLADGVIDAREKQLIYEISRARTSIREQETEARTISARMWYFFILKYFISKLHVLLHAPRKYRFLFGEYRGKCVLQKLKSISSATKLDKYYDTTQLRRAQGKDVQHLDAARSPCAR